MSDRIKRFEENDYEVGSILMKEIHVPKRFDRTLTNDLHIEELALDIKQVGMHTEIWVNRDKDEPNSYVLISGHRRFLAHTRLRKKEIRAKIFEKTELESLYMTCNENSHRLNYNNLESLDSFMYLLFKEHVESSPSAPVDYTPSRYIASSATIIRALRRKELKDELALKQLSSAQKAFQPLIEKVFKSSGLFSTYERLDNMITITEMSSETRKFCVDNALSISSMTLLAKAEKAHKDKYMPSEEDEERIKVIDSILDSLLMKDGKKVQKIAYGDVQKVIKEHNKKLEDHKNKASKIVQAGVDIQYSIDNLTELIDSNDVLPSTKRRIMKISSYLKKELQTINKLETKRKNKEAKK